MPIFDPRDTRFMTHEKCAIKRLVGAFEMDWAGHRFQLRHQPNDLRDVGETSQEENFTKSSMRVRA